MANTRHSRTHSPAIRHGLHTRHPTPVSQVGVLRATLPLWRAVAYMHRLTLEAPPHRRRVVLPPVEYPPMSDHPLVGLRARSHPRLGEGAPLKHSCCTSGSF